MNKQSDIFGAAVAFEGGMVVLALLIGHWMDPRPQDHITWSLEGLGWGIAGTLPLLAAFAITRRLPFKALQRLKQFVDETLVQMFQSCTIPQLAVIALLAGLGEELLFRGLMQAWLEQQAGVFLAVVLTSVVFGLLHAVSVAYAIAAALISVYLGWMMIATENLLPSMITHGLYDFVVLVYLAKKPEKQAGEPAVDVEDLGRL